MTRARRWLGWLDESAFVIWSSFCLLAAALSLILGVVAVLLPRSPAALTLVAGACLKALIFAVVFGCVAGPVLSVLRDRLRPPSTPSGD